MLNNKLKEKIRKVNDFKYSLHEENSVPVTIDQKEFVIPSFIELRKSVIEQLLEIGFDSVEPIAPKYANCIIRVFKCLHLRYETSFCNAYGYCCYTRLDGEWLSASSSKDLVPINYSKHVQKLPLLSDECILFDTEFFDFYCFLDLG